MVDFLLYEKLFPYISGFRVFRYTTFRTAFASLTALFLCIALGPWLIGKLREFHIGQYIREEGPTSHKKKAGTPTMGGVLIVISIVIPTLLWADLRQFYVWIALFSLVTYAAIGFADDYAKVMKKQNLGLTGRRKFFLQVLVAFVLASVLLVLNVRGLYTTNMNVPFLKQWHPNLLIDTFLTNRVFYPLAFVPFFIFVAFVVVGASNAVNLTDGLDGLAIGLMVIASEAFTILTYPGGNSEVASYLHSDRNSPTLVFAVLSRSMI